MTIRTLAVLALVTALLSLASRHFARGEDFWNVKRLLEEQEHLGRKLGVQDVYKLLYQGSFGVDHILADTAVAHQGLLDEMAALDTLRRGEPLVERISSDGSVVRINLRPFRRRGLSSESLFRVMVQSASGEAPDTVRFLNLWNNFTALVRYGFIVRAHGDLEGLDDMVRRSDIHPGHHSPEYIREYAPAYRVARKSVFERVFASDLSSEGGGTSPEDSRK